MIWGRLGGDVMPDPAELTAFSFTVPQVREPPDYATTLRSLGFSGAAIAYNLRSPDWTIIVEGSCWRPLVLTAVLPAWWLARRRGWIRRWPAGACAHCGIDLRGGGTHCPECGSLCASSGAAAK